jgi:hypothetical protein
MNTNKNEEIMKLPPELVFAKEIMLHETRIVDDLEIGNLFLVFKTLEFVTMFFTILSNHFLK